MLNAVTRPGGRTCRPSGPPARYRSSWRGIALTFASHFQPLRAAGSRRTGSKPDNMKTALVLVASLLLIGSASAQFCIGKYSQEKEIDIGEFIVISFNKLNNVHLVFSESEGPVVVKMYGNKKFSSVDDWVSSQHVINRGRRAAQTQLHVR